MGHRDSYIITPGRKDLHVIREWWESHTKNTIFSSMYSVQTLVDLQTDPFTDLYFKRSDLRLALDNQHACKPMGLLISYS